MITPITLTTAEASARLRTFIETGCALSVEGLLFLPAVAEIVGRNLFWVGQFPEDQHHAHATAFDKIEQPHELGLAFYRAGSGVAYVAGFDEWPELDSDAARKERARWERHLADEANLSAFRRFTASERDLRT